MVEDQNQIEKKSHYLRIDIEAVSKLEEDVLTAHELGKALNIDWRSVLKRIARGMIPFHRGGRKIFIFKQEYLNKLKEELNETERTECDCKDCECE
jgi:hypothetical protein